MNLFEKKEVSHMAKKIIAWILGFIASILLMVAWIWLGAKTDAIVAGAGTYELVRGLIGIWGLSVMIEESVMDRSTRCMIPDMIFATIIAICIVQFGFEISFDSLEGIFDLMKTPVIASFFVAAFSAFASEPIISAISKK